MSLDREDEQLVPEKGVRKEGECGDIYWVYGMCGPANEKAIHETQSESRICTCEEARCPHAKAAA